MCVSVRAVDRSFSTLRLCLYDCTYNQWCLLFSVFFTSWLNRCVIGPFTVYICTMCESVTSPLHGGFTLLYQLGHNLRIG